MSRRISLPPYPNGWYCVALSDELAPGQVVARQQFGQELVIFRTESGRVGVADAYCPHIGAHLGHGGKIEGETLQCPFHGWRFEADGRCVEMPYGGRIPPKARLGSLPVREQNGVVLAFHDSEGREPAWEMPLFDDAHLSPCIQRTWVVETHPQEVLENSADCAHFRFIHGTHMVRPVEGPTAEGPIYRTKLVSDPELLAPKWRLPDNGGIMDQEAMCHGPGLVMAITTTRGSGVTGIARLYVTPIDEERSQLRGVCNLVELDDPQRTDAVAAELSKLVFEQWENDIPIWEHKRYRPEPALNDANGAFVTFRRWMKQFYPGSTEAA